MAASERQVELINCILKNLEQDSQVLHDALSTYVEQVKSAGRIWVESQGMNSSSFRDIRSLLHNSADFIMDIAERIQSAPRMDETDESHKFRPATPQDMPTSSSVSSLPSSSSSKLAGPGSSLADHFLLKLQDRLETVEKEMTHVVEMKEEMDGLKEGMDKVKEEMGDFRDEIKGLNDDMKKVKKTKGKIDKIQKRVGELEESKTEMEETISKFRSDHEELSGQVTQLSDNYNENKAKNHGWLRKFEDKMYTHEQSCLSVTSNLQTEIDGFNQQMVNTENRMGEIEKEKEGESAKVELLEERVKELKKNLVKVELTEKRMDKVEGDLKEMKKEEETKSAKLKMLEEKIEKQEKEYELILERVEELEGDMHDVQTIKLEEIEEKISRFEEEKADQEKQKLLEDRLAEMEVERKKEAKHMGDIQSELKRCVSSVDAIEKRRQLQVAVCARLSGGHRLQSDTVLKCFTTVINNKGGHYDPSSGMFTAPVDGVYMTSLVHRQMGKDCVGLTLYHVVANPGSGGVSEEMVCVTYTNVQYTSCTDVRVVWMSAGDKLYVKVTSSKSDMSIWWPTSFSCFLIN